MVTLFINDANLTSGGSHWSTLLVFPKKESFHHIDTILDANKSYAYEISLKIYNILNWSNMSFINCQSNLQKNGFDCGIHTINHAILAVRQYLKKKDNFDDFCEVHNQSKITGMRFEILKQLMIQQPLNSSKENKITEKWGSKTCSRYKSGKNCDFCSHVNETQYVYSLHYQNTIRVRGHLRHDYAPQNYIRWFIYLIEDSVCMKQYTGSTTDLVKRWANHKSQCNLKNPHTCKTGLTRHFINGCEGDKNKNKDNLRITLLNYLDTTEQELKIEKHIQGPGCKCRVCTKLRRLECKYIVNLGTISEKFGLNSKDELDI